MEGLECFTLERLKAATNQFEELLGEGGHAKVYSGAETGSDGIQRFAVKVATVKAEPEKFQREIERVGNLDHHPNLVRLIGYCHEREDSTNVTTEKEQILVYQLAVHGALNETLDDITRRELLQLPARIRIAEGTAQAIAFLHERNLIHGDVKPHNILLNENMEALLADYGTLELYMQGFLSLAVRSKSVSTPGYTDIDLLLRGTLELACDVYSFGVVVLQLVFGEPALLRRGKCRLPLSADQQQIFLAAWARDREQDPLLDELRDPCLAGASATSLRKLLRLGLRCVCVGRAQRPDIFQVVEEFESIRRDNSGITSVPPQREPTTAMQRVSVAETDVWTRSQTLYETTRREYLYLYFRLTAAADGALYWVFHDRSCTLIKVWRHREWVQLCSKATPLILGFQQDFVSVRCAAATDGTVWVGSGGPLTGWKDGHIIGTLGSRDSSMVKVAATSTDVFWTAQQSREVTRWGGGGLAGRAQTFRVPGKIRHLAAARDGGTLWVSTEDSDDGPWYITGWRDGNEVYRLPVHCGVDHLEVGPDEALWSASYQSSGVKGWRGGECVVALDTMGPVHALGVGRDGSVCAAGYSGETRTVYVMEWKVDSDGGRVWKLVGQRSYAVPGGRDYMQGCAFSGDGTLWSIDFDSCTVTAWSHQ